MKKSQHHHWQEQALNIFRYNYHSPYYYHLQSTSLTDLCKNFTGVENRKIELVEKQILSLCNNLRK